LNISTYKGPPGEENVEARIFLSTHFSEILFYSSMLFMNDHCGSPGLRGGHGSCSIRDRGLRRVRGAATIRGKRAGRQVKPLYK
jgi:hypothetical protein